jgi:hypothetical protein
MLFNNQIIFNIISLINCHQSIDIDFDINVNNTSNNVRYNLIVATECFFNFLIFFNIIYFTLFYFIF